MKFWTCTRFSICCPTNGTEQSIIMVTMISFRFFVFFRSFTSIGWERVRKKNRVRVCKCVYRLVRECIKGKSRTACVCVFIIAENLASCNLICVVCSLACISLWIHVENDALIFNSIPIFSISFHFFKRAIIIEPQDCCSKWKRGKIGPTRKMRMERKNIRIVLSRSLSLSIAGRDETIFCYPMSVDYCYIFNVKCNFFALQAPNIISHSLNLVNWIWVSLCIVVP